MPISDLLASITGEKGGSSSSPAPRPIATVPKRKADDELRSAPLSKTPRIDAATRPSIHSTRPADKPATSLGNKTTLTSRPSSNAVSTARNSGSNTASSNGTGTISKQNGSKPLPSKPVANRPPQPPVSSGPPKAKSFAEIMARARANSDVRASLGRINHKPVERNLTMKERKELRAEEAKRAKVDARKTASGRAGIAAGSSSSVPSRNTQVAGAKRNGVSPAASNGKKGAPVEEEKKVKKAALATTGYQGTARPRPGAASASKPGAASRRDEPDRASGKSRVGNSRRGYGRPSDYDDGEDLDDFIEYDDDQDERGYGYGGYSEDESDMEAGLSEIDEEETAAERRARLEDKAEEALEKRLKREKEERKRRLLEQNRARAGNR